ncbi:MAG: zinc-dependent alcohol dehydrogenase family protein [Janthinobacterium lividum]
MRGVVFGGDREVELMRFPDPEPGPGEVVIEMKASGMCGSDLHQYRRPRGGGVMTGLPVNPEPVIVGHEPAGVVAAVGAGVGRRTARVGQRVMVHHYQGCTACNHCRGGWTQLCQEVPIQVYGNNQHGGHADYLKVPANTVLPLDDALSFRAGAAISCGTGTAYGALRRANLSGNDTVAIFGQGPVGLSATQLAVAMGARVIALDVSPERLARARQFGAFETIDPRADDPAAAIRELTGGRGVDVAVDTSAAPEARRAAVRSAKVWGTMVCVGEGGELVLDVSPDLLRRQLSVVGSWTFSTIGQAECARFVAERGIDVDALFTDTYTLDEADAAYRAFDRQTGGKGVFLF